MSGDATRPLSDVLPPEMRDDLTDNVYVTDARLVYCTYCNKTHAVKPDEKPCAPGAWLDPEPVR